MALDVCILDNHGNVINGIALSEEKFYGIVDGAAKIHPNGIIVKRINPDYYCDSEIFINEIDEFKNELTEIIKFFLTDDDIVSQVKK
jgi:hypothetical protein